MLKLATIVWGVKEFDAAVRFWQAALDYVPRDQSEDASDGTWTMLVPREGPGVQLAIQLVSSDAASHQRHHMDLYADSAAAQAAEVERLIGLGATRVDWRYPEDADYVVLADPDGNQFCIVDTSIGS